MSEPAVKQLTPSAPDPPSWQAALYASVQVTQTLVTAAMCQHSYVVKVILYTFETILNHFLT